MVGPALAGILFEWNSNSPYVLGTVVLGSCFILAIAWSRKKVPHLLNAS